jgi:hypothetical protein
LGAVQVSWNLHAYSNENQTLKPTKCQQSPIIQEEETVVAKAFKDCNSISKWNFLQAPETQLKIDHWLRYFFSSYLY